MHFTDLDFEVIRADCVRTMGEVDLLDCIDADSTDAQFKHSEELNSSFYFKDAYFRDFRLASG